MAEIDLISSHHPWTPLPHLVPWDQVGDGSVFDGMPEQGEQLEGGLPGLRRGQAGLRRVVEYSWQALTSFLTTYNDPNLVLVVLGDHQPHTYVSGEHAGHDVPISVIAQDPAVMRADRRLGLAGRPAPVPGRAGLADGHLPRPVPRRVQRRRWSTRRKVCAGSTVS